MAYYRLRDFLAAAAVVSAASARLNDGVGSVVGPGGEQPLSIPPRAHELDASYTFEQYLVHFDKSYDDPEEFDRRSKIFASNLATILAHNDSREFDENGALVGGGWIMGVGAYTDVEVGELPMGYDKLQHPTWRDQLNGGGASRVQRLLADGGDDAGADTDTDTTTESYSQPASFTIDDVASLPESVDWSATGNVNPTVPQQGGCGSCWSFASTAAIESHLSIATGDDVMSLSEQDMLECAPNPDHCGGEGACTGSTVELALNYVADKSAKKTGGMFSITDVPYEAAGADISKCKEASAGKTPSVGIEGWTRLESNNYEVAMNALAKVGPLAIALAAGGWSHYKGGVFETDDTTVNHAVLLVGYGVDEETQEKYWKVRNSWGPTFGEDGYIRIKRSDDDSNNCATDTDPLVGIACALDDAGNKIDVEPVKVCGTGAILFDSVYPVKPFKIK